LPDSGNPKLDYVVKLADVLEWPVSEVVDVIHGEHVAASELDATHTMTFLDLIAEVDELLRVGDYTNVVERARQISGIASTGDELAHVLIREAAGWDGLGRYTKAQEAAQRGLRIPGLSVRLRLVLQATLANAQYTLWDLTPALGTCEVLAKWYEMNPPERDIDHKRIAYVLYVRGHTRRRLMAMQPESSQHHAQCAADDLTHAIEMYDQLTEEYEDDRLRGFAHTCRGGLLEIDVELGNIRPQEALEQLYSETALPLTSDDTGDWQESLGWRCIFGSNIALRHLEGNALQRYLSRFLARALEIAERSNNWAMRERVYTMQYSLHRELSQTTGLELDYTISEQVHSRVGLAMGRFPAFRDTGWQILKEAKVTQS